MSSPAATGPADPEQLTPAAKRALGFAFLTLFIDLIGFSIIFPLFPAMLEYYRIHESGDGLFSLLSLAMEHLARLVGSPHHDAGVTVLFGGILGSIYSLLQFACAPIFGSISDRVGRRPVLLISLCGILVSYVCWFFAGNFTLLVVSRVIGGVMSANISTVSAVVSDVTTPRTRSKGMALIGIAFGLGFTLGPAFGGLSSLLDISAHFPALVAYGVNPWSVAALVAFALTLVNLLQVFFLMPETLPVTGHSERIERSLNPIKLFHTEAYPGVSRTNFAYFVFLLAFSGMEFSLTFLAADRFGYTPAKNALLFLVVGIVLAGVQGSYVQKYVGRIGPRRMAVHGLLCIVPGLLLIGLSGHYQVIALLYAGIVLLAAGAAQATPCLTSLVSLYTPPEEQGRIMGVFRSLGALSRAFGPLLACVIYWRLGGSAAYFLGAAAMILPILLARGLPEPRHAETR